MLRALLVTAMLAGGTAAGCGPQPVQPPRSYAGSHLVVLADWKNVEQHRFAAVLRAFEKQTGATIDYITPADGVPEMLAALVGAGRAPDVAFLPQPALLRHYAAAGKLVPLDKATAQVVEQNYAQVWRRLGSAGQTLYGVWFKAADKSLIWYNIGAFERAGVVPPDTLDGLRHVAARLAAAGISPFAVGGRDGWTLTDVFENLYVRIAGGDRYDRLATHDLAWTDPSVVATLTAMQQLLRPGHLYGGTGRALRASFEDAAAWIATRPPAAAMTIEADFVAGALSTTSARLDTDVDVFPFPAVNLPQPVVLAGGDVAVQFRRSPAAAAFMQYLATPEAASVWAAKGGFISPSAEVDLAEYPDALSRSFARMLVEAGNGLRFDLSDQQPASFGSNERSGMAPALRALLSGRSAEAVAAQLETDARRAFREGRP